MQQLKRKLTMTLAWLPLAALLTSCQSNALGQRPQAPPLSEAQNRLKNIGLTLVVDAAQGQEMLGNELFADGSEFAFYAKSSLKGGRNRDIMVFPMDAVPDQVRVIWRNSTKLVRHPKNNAKSTYEGNVLGDYTLPIASRIPDDVVRDIRKSGGNLRLKFRLTPNGVLFGWDIERFSGGLPRHTLPGGDFLDTEY